MPLEEQKIYLHQRKKVNETLICIEHKEACRTMQTNVLITHLQKAMYSKYLFAIENQTLKANSYTVPTEPKCEYQWFTRAWSKGRCSGCARQGALWLVRREQRDHDVTVARYSGCQARDVTCALTSYIWLNIQKMYFHEKCNLIYTWERARVLVTSRSSLLLKIQQIEDVPLIYLYVRMGVWRSVDPILFCVNQLVLFQGSSRVLNS